MADLTLKEKLQPSLLDRLTDREPETNRESRDRRIISENQLRDCVIRDLGWLLNTPHFEAIEDLGDCDAVRKSVINYGIPDLAGVIASSADPKKLEQGLRDAILRFEPRIMANSLKIKIDMDKGAASPSALSFRIEADLWAQPVPLNLYLHTQVDLETGTVNIVESAR